MEHLEKQLKVLPVKPGIYMFKNAIGNVLYVGKAINLKSRVSSYFNRSYEITPKHQKMLGLITDIDFIITDSELEAIILECNLIKKYSPFYNVRLKDDKTYPYLKIEVKDEWPRVYITRRVERDGSYYFGPYANPASIRITMDLVKKIFPYRSCKKNITGAETRPCLNYHIRRCSAPCISAVSKEEYRVIINEVIFFLEGKQGRVIKEIKKKMEEAAGKLEFERAATLRDQLVSIENVTERQKVFYHTLIDEDVIAYATDNDTACVQIFFIREGKLIGKEHFLMEGVLEERPDIIITSFFKQFYSSTHFIPRQILVQIEPEELPELQNWLGSKRGSAVTIAVPSRGEKKKLIKMVEQNAVEALEQHRFKKLIDSGKTAAALVELQERLKLTGLPNRIECYDISDVQGTSAVGSMVVFQEGQPKPSHYRRFKIKTITGNDDYAMMKEVLGRRFGSSSQSNSTNTAQNTWAIVPDLVLIDGGKGHLNVASEVINGLKLSISLAGIAKGNEDIFIPGRSTPVPFESNSQALYLLQRIRDEAHRFAVSYHHQLRQKKVTISALDTVPGVGPKRKKALLKKFGSVKRIREASIEDLVLVEGINELLAKQIKEQV